MKKFLFSVSGGAAALYMLCNGHNQTSGLQYYCLVPFLFSMLCLLFSKTVALYTKRVSVFILLTVGCVRYVICPLLLSLADYKFANAGLYNINSYETAVFMQMYEMVVFFAVLHFSAEKKNRKRTEDNSANPINGKGIYVLFIIIGFVCMAVFPEISQRQHWIFNLAEESDSIYSFEEDAISGLFPVLSTTARYLLILVILAGFYKRYLSEGHPGYVTWSFIVIGLNAMVSTDMSRFGILIPFASFLTLILYLYPERRKYNVFSGLSLIFLVMVLVSFVKFFGQGRGGDVGDSADIGWWANTMNQYFMGIKDTAIGISAYSLVQTLNGGLGITSFMNDVISNVMYLSHFSMESMSSLVIFNNVYSSRVSQCNILPNICAGLYYFGYIFSPALTAIFTHLSVRFEQFSIETDVFEYKYLFILAMVLCSFCMMIYYTMIISYMTNLLLPVLLVVYCQKFLRGRNGAIQ